MIDQSNNGYEFSVGGFRFNVTVPSALDIFSLLPAYHVFMAGDNENDRLFCLKTVDTLPHAEDIVRIEQISTDIGAIILYRTRQGYRLDVRPNHSRTVHRMITDARFTHALATVMWSDRYAGNALDAMLRTMFSMSVLFNGGISVHASCVVNSGRAYLFMGRSGTGKSTHSSLWIRNIPGTMLLNDDNPVIRLSGHTLMAYGTPWSGKTPCYQAEGYPVAGIVRLVQSSHNVFTPKYDVDAFSVILPGCSAIRQDGYIFGALCDILAEISVMSPVGTMECLPDNDAALICHGHLKAMCGTDGGHVRK